MTYILSSLIKHQFEFIAEDEIETNNDQGANFGLNFDDDDDDMGQRQPSSHRNENTSSSALNHDIVTASLLSTRSDSIESGSSNGQSNQVTTSAGDVISSTVLGKKGPVCFNITIDICLFKYIYNIYVFICNSSVYA